MTAPDKTYRSQLADSMATRHTVYQLAEQAHQTEGTGATYRALEAARVARRDASDKLDAFDAADAEQCPECGSAKDKHEDNGVSPRAYDYTKLCTACGHQWSPNEG